MKFREMTQKDIEFMANHSVSRGILKKLPQQLEFAYALEHEGIVLGIGGITLMTPTTAWCWIDLSTYAGHHITTCYRVIKEWMDILIKEKGLKRLMAYVECDFPEAVRTAEHLGFHKEHTMPNFINDKPAFLYVRII